MSKTIRNRNAAQPGLIARLRHAYNKGWEAHDAGKAFNEGNPHQRNSEQDVNYLRGWNDAQDWAKPQSALEPGDYRSEAEEQADGLMAARLDDGQLDVDMENCFS
jgi:hypothetical protein